MSKGVRIYVHWSRNNVQRQCFNIEVGARQSNLWRADRFRVIATGCEEGALTVHLRPTN